MAYVLVVDPFPVTIKSADGTSVTTWTKAGELSDPMILTGLRPMSPWRVVQLTVIAMTFVAFAAFRYKDGNRRRVGA